MFSNCWTRGSLVPFFQITNIIFEDEYLIMFLMDAKHVFLSVDFVSFVSLRPINNLSVM